jgi:HAMP domain-containing protein
MKVFTSELQYLSELYQRLSSELKAAAGNHADSGRIAGTVLDNRELVSRIEQLNARVAQLADEWETVRGRVDAPVRAEVEALAAAVRKQATELSQVCAESARRLEKGLQAIARELGDLRRGSRYLESVKPAKTNYPKFVDSVG